MSARTLAWLAICALALGAQAACAQSGSVSYSLWSLNGHRVTMRFMLPVADANRVAGTDIDVLTMSRFGDYLLDHVAVRAAGQDCPAIDQGYDLGKVDPLTVGPGLDGFEIFFECEQATHIVIEDHALFGRLPAQVDFARMQVNGGAFAQQLFTASDQRLTLPDSAAVPSAGIARYVSLGGDHVDGNLDRLCFLLGVLLLAGRPRQLGQVIAALAGGYLLSVPVSLLGLITPRTLLLNAFIGFLIALLAAQLVARQLQRPRLLAIGAAGVLLWLAAIALLAHAGWPVWLLIGAALFAGGYLSVHARFEEHSLAVVPLAALFGFLDGCLLPAQLLPLQLPVRTQLPMLSGFDIGAVLVEALLLFALYAAGAALRVSRWRSAARGLLQDVATASLGGLGLFWLVSRLPG